MRVSVSVDMDAVAEVATLDQIIRGLSSHPQAHALMTAEDNAARSG